MHIYTRTETIQSQDLDVRPCCLAEALQIKESERHKITGSNFLKRSALLLFQLLRCLPTSSSGDKMAYDVGFTQRAGEGLVAVSRTSSDSILPGITYRTPKAQWEGEIGTAMA